MLSNFQVRMGAAGFPWPITCIVATDAAGIVHVIVAIDDYGSAAKVQERARIIADALNKHAEQQRAQEEPAS